MHAVPGQLVGEGEVVIISWYPVVSIPISITIRYVNGVAPVEKMDVMSKERQPRGDGGRTMSCNRAIRKDLQISWNDQTVLHVISASQASELTPFVTIRRSFGSIFFLIAKRRG